MLLPVEFLHGGTRFDLFQDRRFPLRVVYVFSSRLCFGSKTHATVGHAWYVWDRRHKGSRGLRGFGEIAELVAWIGFVWMPSYFNHQGL
jgi:hypothetical protein